MKKFRTKLAKIFVSFFGIGYLRPYSATWGSLASGLMLYFFWPQVDSLIKILAIMAIFIFGSVFSHYLERESKIHDPYFIVIDEVVGMMIATFFLPQTWSFWIVTFLLFRLFDIAKPWPASFFDQRKGGLAIMLDDVVAGLFVLITIQALFFALQ